VGANYFFYNIGLCILTVVGANILTTLKTLIKKKVGGVEEKIVVMKKTKGIIAGSGGIGKS